MRRTNPAGVGLRLALVALLGVAIAAYGADFDLVVNNGRVIDPESKLDAVRSVGVTGGKIAAISEQPLSGRTTIDARGLVVSPGFIDLHSHAVMTLAGARMHVMDGVTTAFEFENGVLPVAQSYDFVAGEGRPLNYGFSVSWVFARALAVDGTPVEEFTPDDWDGVFQRTDWQGYFPEDRARRVVELVEQGLREGGIGVGSNLGYMPDANHEELYELAKLTTRFGNSPIFVHIRHNEPYGPNNNLAAHEEVIAVAAMTGAHMHFCHLNSNANHHIPDRIRATEKARSLGVNVTWEAYPYGAGSTFIGGAYLVPDNLPNMGMESTDILYLKTGERVPSNERLAQLQKEDPSGFSIFFLLDENDPKERALLDQAVVHPESAIASDATYWQVGSDVIRNDVWPLPADAVSHPRSAGTFSRVVGPYVREGKLSLMDAIRKMTLVPAGILEESVPQMRQKGRIKVGADADLAVFDAATVGDRATYEKPNQTSAGIRHVIVNGEVTVSDGQLLTDARSGQPVRRPVTPQ